MKKNELDETLYILRDKLAYERYVKGNGDKIRVRMGRELATYVRGYTTPLIINHADETQSKSIFGYPLEIDNVNTMCLEVHIVENVPIYKESDV